MCQILKDAFLIEIHSKPSEFWTIHILNRQWCFIYLLSDKKKSAPVRFQVNATFKKGSMVAKSCSAHTAKPWLQIASG